MARFVFADGHDICVYDGEKVTKYSSSYIERYIRSAEESNRSTEWKRSGENAVFRGDASYQGSVRRAPDCALNGVYPTDSDDWVVYSFSADSTSGIYKKCLSDSKTPEAHVINSNNLTFCGGMVNVEKNTLVTSVKRGYYNADIAVFDLNTGDYKCLTDGDTLDTDPHICPDNDSIIYFSSRGAGRDSRGEFAGFSPSAICKLDLNAMTVDEVLSSPKYHYFKPVCHNGKLYAIKAPVKERNHNAFVEFLLFPWRILQAIASFINIFVTATTGKPLAEGGANPAKGRDYDSRKIEIAGNLIDVDKQLKKNASKKDSDFGFIPKSWELVEAESGKVIKSGVGDFDIDVDGTIIATNGRRIFAIKDGKSKKVCNADYCIKLSCRHSAKSKSDEPFGF